MAKETPIWATRDGREIPLDEMPSPHVALARAKLKEWLKGERDPDVRRDLTSWAKRFSKELKARDKAWRDQYARKRG